VSALVAAGVVLLALGVLWRLAPPRPLRPPERGAVFSNVTVVNPGAGRQAGQTVRVEGGRIASIEPGGARAGPAETDGGYLLPGLVDMHVHGADSSIDGQEALFSLLYLAHGVTALRNTGGGSDQLAQRERIARGDEAGPRIFACGPLHDGKPPIWAFSTVVETPAEAEQAVAYVADTGFDCVKVYERLLPEAQAALVRAARERRLPVVGHVPDRVRFEDAGIDDIQHLRGIERAEGREPILDVRRMVRRHQDWAALSAERIDYVARTSLAKGIAYTPTLALIERGSRMDRLDEQMAEPVMRLLPRFYSALSWDPRGFSWYAEIEESDWALARAAKQSAARMVAALFRAGVRIHAGTDVGNPFLVPGASLHEELRQLVAAGLTPEEAWLTATRWPGEFLREPGLGTLEPGAPADLLLFREDPTRDLAALDTLQAVVADGRLYRRETLADALEASQRLYRGWLYDSVSMAIGTRRRNAALAREE
jgi:cytosine/adenosine deaminase-related metal-dependent hydrolase